MRRRMGCLPVFLDTGRHPIPPRIQHPRQAGCILAVEAVGKKGSVQQLNIHRTPLQEAPSYLEYLSADWLNRAVWGRGRALWDALLRCYSRFIKRKASI